MGALVRRGAWATSATRAWGRGSRRGHPDRRSWGGGDVGLSSVPRRRQARAIRGSGSKILETRATALRRRAGRRGGSRGRLASKRIAGSSSPVGGKGSTRSMSEPLARGGRSAWCQTDPEHGESPVARVVWPKAPGAGAVGRDAGLSRRPGSPSLGARFGSQPLRRTGLGLVLAVAQDREKVDEVGAPARPSGRRLLHLAVRRGRRTGGPHGSRRWAGGEAGDVLHVVEHLRRRPERRVARGRSIAEVEGDLSSGGVHGDVPGVVEVHHLLEAPSARRLCMYGLDERSGSGRRSEVAAVVGVTGKRPRTWGCRPGCVLKNLVPVETTRTALAAEAPVDVQFLPSGLYPGRIADGIGHLVIRGLPGFLGTPMLAKQYIVNVSFPSVFEHDGRECRRRVTLELGDGAPPKYRPSSRGSSGCGQRVCDIRRWRRHSKDGGVVLRVPNWQTSSDDSCRG